MQARFYVRDSLTAAITPPPLATQQRREGWHLTEEPDLTPDPATDEQKPLVQERAQNAGGPAQAKGL